MLRSRLALAATAVTIAASSSLMTAQTSVADTSAPTIAFRVVEPDGSPVVSPTVVVSVLGPTAPYVRVLPGGAAGQVVVPFPADDPVALSRLAAGDAVNLLIRVYDKQPGKADINAAYVTAAIGVDAFGTLRELSEVTGTVIALRSGLADFYAVSDADIGVPGGGLPNVFGEVPDLPGAPTAGAPDCEEHPLNDGPHWCYTKDKPRWVEHIPVAIADNHGGGNEMYSSMRYHSTKVTQTSVAVQVGNLGYQETEGAVGYEKENSVTLSFRDRGPDDNALAQLDTQFLRERTGWCQKFWGTWQCTLETAYRPYQATGTGSEASWALNDRMDADQDCYVELDQKYEPATKSVDRKRFSFRLGDTETWAATSPSQGALYANTTITQQTMTGTSFIRKWQVASGATKDYHYVYVPYGQTLYPGADVGDCVGLHLGEAQTQATDYELNRLPAPNPVQNVPSDANPATNENTATEPVCGNMPDRCD